MKKINLFQNECYIIALVGIALFFGIVIQGALDGLCYDESVVIGRAIPWMIIPTLTCVLLSALFIDHGYIKEVGMTGLWLMMASAVVISGSLLWMNAVDGTDILTVTLNGYEGIRFPIAVCLVGMCLMKGGAIVVLMSLLVRERNSSNASTVKTYCGILALVSFLAFMISREEAWSWMTFAVIVFVFLLLLIPAVLIYSKMEIPVVEDAMNTSPAKSSCLPLITLSINAITIYAYWFIFSSLRFFSNFSSWDIRILPLSTLATCLSIFALKKSSRDFSMLGAILLLAGYPLSALTLGMEAVRLLPQLMIGAGTAFILCSTLNSFVNIRSNYAWLWVAIIAAIILVGRIAIICMHRIQVLCTTPMVNFYLVFPLVCFLLLALSFWSRTLEKD